MKLALALVTVVGCANASAPSPPVTRVDVAPIGPVEPLAVEPTPKVIEVAASAQPPTRDGAFDKMKALTAMAAVDLQPCAIPNGPSGPGHVEVTFDLGGSVSTVVVDSPPFAGTPQGGCIAAAFGTVHVPPFHGVPVRVGKSFVVP